MKTLYVSDLDGTLLNEHARLSDYTVAMLNQLITQGMLFTYATARSYSSASKLINDVRFLIPAVTYNGAFVVNPQNGERMESVQFQRKEIDYVQTVFHNQNINPLVYSIMDGKERVSWLKGNESRGLLRYLKQRQADPRLRPVQQADEVYQGEVFYFTVIGEQKKLEQVKICLDDIPKSEVNIQYLLQEEIYQNEEYWLEIMPKRATKAEGVKRLKQLLGCDRVVCFGDGLNDIPMFEIAEEAYAVCNAVEELKAMATGIINGNNEDGVAKWLLENFKT